MKKKRIQTMDHKLAASKSHCKAQFGSGRIFFVRDGIHSVADYNSTHVVVVVVVIVVVNLFHDGLTWSIFIRSGSEQNPNI